MRIGAGIYIENGAVEIDVPEMLRAMGVADTEENRDLCVELAEKALKKSGLLAASAAVRHTHAHRCPHCARRWSHDGKLKKCPLGKRAACGRCNS